VNVLRKLFFLTVPAAIAVLLVVEIGVRLTWDRKRGTPGLFIADPVLVQRFAPNYTGWFAGVPVHINNLGLRDPRDYSLSKQPNTFRILVLGDSVTFGHGSIYEHTYPYLLEQHLKAWKPQIDWQVWNAGVPGYNSAQELAYLQRVGPSFKPDLVVVGFYPNDIMSNDLVAEPSDSARAISGGRNWVKSHFYSYELYRRLYLELAWRALGSSPAKTMLENLGSEDALLADMGSVQNLPQQQFTEIVPVAAEIQANAHCHSDGRASREVAEFSADRSAETWRAAIRGFQALQPKGENGIAFFINNAPEVCMGDDLFFDGGSRAWDDFFISELSKGVPVLSTYDAFLRYRPSQVPQAKGHSLGNANRVKADVLFDFLRGHVLAAVPALQDAKSGLN
jgi:hypothetical protein